MEQQYSSCGWSNVLYAFDLRVGGLTLRFRFEETRVLFDTCSCSRLSAYKFLVNSFVPTERAQSTFFPDLPQLRARSRKNVSFAKCLGSLYLDCIALIIPLHVI